MRFKYRNPKKMKLSKQIVFLGFLLLVVCLISLIPFSQKDGFFSSYDAYYQELDKSVIAAVLKTKTGSGSSSGNAKTTGSSVISKDYSDDSSHRHSSHRSHRHSYSHQTIRNNSDFLTAVTSALKTKPDVTTDLNVIYSIETEIADMDTVNARKLLAEMGSPNVVKNPREFLKYMNWYGTNCPINSDVCVNVF